MKANAGVVQIALIAAAVFCVATGPWGFGVFFAIVLVLTL